VLTKQAKALSDRQVRTVLTFLDTTRDPVRNKLIFLLSAKAGLRAKEIASLRWSMVVDPQGEISDVIRLPDGASKGKSGGVIPMAKQLCEALCAWAQCLGGSVPRVRCSRRTCHSYQQIKDYFPSSDRECLLALVPGIGIRRLLQPFR